VSRRLLAVAALVACSLGLPGCRTIQDLRATGRALERAGYRDVAVSARSGGGVDVVTVHAAAAPGQDPDRAAGVVWRTLAVRFDRLVVWVGTGPASSYAYDDLAVRFGPRDPALDRGQVGDAVGNRRAPLLATLALGALLAGAGLLSGGLLVRRGLRAGSASPGRPSRGRSRGGRDQAEGPSSGPGDASPTAEASVEAEGPEAIPS
jgi:predicted small secreted protein